MDNMNLNKTNLAEDTESSNATPMTGVDKPNKKIQAINPTIIVGTKESDKTDSVTKTTEHCYSILYYDISDSTWHIGYSSYNLNFVRQWLDEYFEPVDAPVIPKKVGCRIDGHCSICGEPRDTESNFCPNCGAMLTRQEVIIEAETIKSDNSNE